MSKGGRFENRRARDLSRWLTDGEDHKQLIRSKGSGGWRGNTGEDTWRHAGDLAPNGPAGEEFCRHFVVECKHRETVDLWHFYTAQPGRQNIAGWWGKLVDEIEATDADPPPAPMLLFRMNHRPLMAGLPKRLVEELPQALTFNFDPDLLLPPFGMIPFEDFTAPDPEMWYTAVRLWRAGL